MTKTGPARFARLCLCLCLAASLAPHAAANIDAAVESPPAAEFAADAIVVHDAVVAEGQTLNRILMAAGASRADALFASLALGKVTDLRRMQPGQELAIYFTPLGAGGNRLAGMALALRGGGAAVAYRTFSERFEARRMPRADAAELLGSILDAPDGAMTRDLAIPRGGSLGQLLLDNGAAPEDVSEAALALSESVDLARLPAGQTVAVTFDRPGGGRPARLAAVALATRDGASHFAERGEDGAWLGAAPDNSAPAAPPLVETPPAAPGGGFRAVGAGAPPSAGAGNAPSAASLEARVGAAPVAALAESGFSEMTVRRGDTLVGILRRAGFSKADSRAAARAADAVYDMRKLRAGGEIEYRAAAGPAAPPPLGAVRVHIDAASRVDVVRLEGGNYIAGMVEKRLVRALRRVEGVVDDNFHDALSAAGAPAGIISAAARILGYSVDFQRDVRTGDEFCLVFESFLDEDGEEAMFGNIEYAAMLLSDKPLTLYRYEFPDGRHDYFDENGRSGRKALMRTPIDGARLTSRFGSRRHPVSGFTAMHRGVDFGAPTGTPIYAAGDGVVERAGRNGGYGRYIRIRHNGMYKTVYAHLSRFASGLRAGKRVVQGETIGYVGSSGLSTGPHLHYEVVFDGKQVNPLSIALPSGEPLDDSELAVFTPHRRMLDRLSRELPLGTAVAFRDRRPGITLFASDSVR